MWCQVTTLAPSRILRRRSIPREAAFQAILETLRETRPGWEHRLALPQSGRLLAFTPKVYRLEPESREIDPRSRFDETRLMQAELDRGGRALRNTRRWCAGFSEFSILKKGAARAGKSIMLAVGGVAEAVGTAPQGRALWGCTPSTYVFAGSRSSSTCILRFILP